MRKTPHTKKKLWEYLDSVGVLENGTDEQIKAAKKEYRKKYLSEFKRKQRAREKEFTIKFSKENGEYDTIEQAARQHDRTIPAFIKTASLAYTRKSYIVPNKLQIAQLEQILSNCLNEIQTLVRRKDIYQFQREQKMEAIENRIQKLETEIRQSLCQAIPIEEFVQKAIQKEPELKERLLILLASAK